METGDEGAWRCFVPCHGTAFVENADQEKGNEKATTKIDHQLEKTKYTQNCR